jgi:hypothetical protein
MPWPFHNPFAVQVGDCKYRCGHAAIEQCRRAVRSELRQHAKGFVEGEQHEGTVNIQRARCNGNSEIRNAKSEGNPKNEIRMAMLGNLPARERDSAFGGRSSGFLRASGFGFRPSAAYGATSSRKKRAPLVVVAGSVNVLLFCSQLEMGDQSASYGLLNSR